MKFKDRRDASLQLIPFLEKYKYTNGVVIAVPRGGVPLGYHIARSFNFPLEIVLVKKISHPVNPEYAIGAVSLNSELIEPDHGVSDEYFKNEIERIRKTLRQRYSMFLKGRNPVDLKGRTVIIVDDGIATGNTMITSIKMMRSQSPSKIIVAVPVAPAETLKKIQLVADEVVCLLVPEKFYGVGQFYEDFSEVTDDQVVRMLNDAPNLSSAA